MSDVARDLVVNETFGPTFQGEGPSTGRYAHFIRLFGCHLSCAWCDTPQTHDPARYDLAAEQRVLSIDDILSWLASTPAELLVITGGEPLLQPRVLELLVHEIRERALAADIEIETSGTISPTDFLTSAVTRFNVSPKLAHSGLRRHQRVRPAVLRHFAGTGKAIWKFVVQEANDLDEVQELVGTYDLKPVWIMPEGTDSATVLARTRLLAEPVLSRRWHLSTRLHTLLWENDRGH
ncbi:7-carboxy-7-deazaguanine synthase QueE [Amycolatopsis roodepoortensis]|uniref:7-carboxy-7-deazaguanine synthase QueE n=1 Tax=Amycolatopsis roodepoortensis TaxID=700274 RepID=UPI00214ABC5D|nr:7-carboxy-7-deazaguanine synthase QueE [Amycolatopsis roodepoortensis]UUV28531.1 7-carboxy-7-deazaguanine synthase QueE [Amycolatopsis roodepoortensis]UUV36037.1 7-carboxy-7-deazaguanine synthase QueE [Amycolatopsis roodepoortensis]